MLQHHQPAGTNDDVGDSAAPAAKVERRVRRWQWTEQFAHDQGAGECGHHDAEYADEGYEQKHRRGQHQPQQQHQHVREMQRHFESGAEAREQQRLNIYQAVAVKAESASAAISTTRNCPGLHSS